MAKFKVGDKVTKIPPSQVWLDITIKEVVDMRGSKNQQTYMVDYTHNDKKMCRLLKESELQPA